MGSVGASRNTNALGIKRVQEIVNSMSYEENPDFINALANAELEFDESNEVRFKFMGKDKSSGRTILMDLTAFDKKSALNDLRANGYTVQRLYTSQVYDALLNHTDGERWNISDATKVDNALLKKNGRR